MLDMEGTSSTSELALGFSEEDSRRQSQESFQTASVSDLTVDTYSSSIPTIDVTTEDGTRSVSGGSSGCGGENIEWTKHFHSLVEEAPLLEATIFSRDNRLKNGVHTQGPKITGGGEKAEQNCQGYEAMECDWIDPELLEEGRKFVRRNFFAVLLAHFIGIAFLLTVRPIQSLLLRTSALHRKENTMRRYLKLILYLKQFYKSPILSTLPPKENSSEKNCHHDIMTIRSMQKNAATNFKIYVPPPWEDLRLTLEEQQIYMAVQEDTKELGDICTNTKCMPKILFTVNPDVPMSQYDLVIIQYAFFGFLVQFPRLFGVYEKVDRNGNSKGMKGFIHLWAVLGNIFGIEDRFNLCIERNYDPDTNELIFNQVFLFSFKTINESAMRLWRSMTSGSSRYFFFFRTKAMLYFMCKDVARLESCKHLCSVMKPMEKFCYYFYKFLVNWLLWIPPFRIIINYSLQLSIYICQYFLKRAKKGECKWETPSICVINPGHSSINKEINGTKN